MQVPSARLILSSNGSCVTVHPGGLIGRLANAEMMIADPRVSEAHALVSLRSRSLRLLALRGSLALDGLDVDAVTLEEGLRIELADGLFVTVEHVELPTHMLVLIGAVQGPVELGSSTHSLVADGQPRTLRMVAGFVPNAAAHLWYSGSRLWIRVDGQEPEAIQSGGKWDVEGCALRVIQLPLGGTPETLTAEQRRRVERASLVILARYTTVHIQRESGTAVLTGKPANLVSELVRFGGKPVPWNTLSQQIWGERTDRDKLRDNFDTTRSRLRRQLRELSIREDLVGLDGSGNVELVLYPGDRMIDES